MPISEKEIEKYGSYARAYYYLVKRPKTNPKMTYRNSKDILPTQETVAENQPKLKKPKDEKSYYYRNRPIILEKAKNRYRDIIGDKKDKLITEDDIKEHGTYSSAYYYKYLAERREQKPRTSSSQ